MPNTGNPLNGLFLSGDGITKTTYTYPSLGVAPRFGMAYDPTGQQKVVLRGGGGLFFDRPNGNDIYAQVTNPPAVQNVTVRYAQLQALSSGLSTVGAPTLNVYQYDAKMPSSWQWNAGVQMALPWAMALDVAYTGQHSWNTPQAVNINAVDFGAAFLPQNQDPTLAASATPGAVGHRHRSDARLPRLRLDQPAHVHAVADVPRHQPVVPAPLHQRRGVRVQRQHHALRPSEQQRAPSARGGRIVLATARTRKKRTRCSRPIRSCTT